MEKIKKYLDEMFKELPRNEAANRIKAEMLENLGERYEELLAETGSTDEAERQVIAEIGTAEEIRETISLASPKKRFSATVVQIIVLVLSVGYVIYMQFTRVDYYRFLNMVPHLVLVTFVLPLLFSVGAWLGMKILNRLTLPKGIFIPNKKIRWALLIVGAAFYGLYGLMFLDNIINEIIGPIPIILFRLHLFMWNNTYLFAIAAVLLYLGKKKQ